MTTAKPAPALPAATMVLSTADGETGSILNGYATDAAGEWSEYEVVTREGIEVWPRESFLLMSEVQDARRENA